MADQYPTDVDGQLHLVFPLRDVVRTLHSKGEIKVQGLTLGKGSAVQDGLPYEIVAKHDGQTIVSPREGN